MINLWVSRNLTNVYRTVRNMATRKKCVYIYDGEGASEMSKLHLKHSLVENLSTRYDVNFISPDGILKGTWSRDAALMAFGGGFDKGFIRTLGTTGVEKIRSYVLNGGKYLGICAGGYFGCDYIEFDKCGPLEVCGERHLKFFPGCGQGPVYPGFKYNDLEGSRVAPIDFKTFGTTREMILTYYYGGGCFLLDESNHCILTPDPDRNERLDVIRKHLKQPVKSLDRKPSHDKNLSNRSDTTDLGSHDTTEPGNGRLLPQRGHDTTELGNGRLLPQRGHDTTEPGNGRLLPQRGHDTTELGKGRLLPQRGHDTTEPGKGRLLPQRGHDTTELSDPVNRTSRTTPDVDILSRYCELPGKPPAIVKCRVGEGRAILCGVHIEYIPWLLLEMEPTLKELVKTLEDTEKQRLDCFRSLLLQLDLEVKTN